MIKVGRDDLYRTLAESSASALFIYQDGGLRYVNPAGEAISGYTQQELLSADLWSLIHPDSRDLVQRLLANWTATLSAAETSEIRILAKDGTEKWVEVVARPAECDSRPAIVGTAVDITGRKNLESRLYQSHKMEALGRLAGGVAHDFNNLLTVIAGYGQMILNRLDAGSPLRADMEEILKGASRAAGLTGQLLAFSRRQAAQPRVLDLNLLVSNTLKMLRRVIGEDISLETHLQPGIGNIKADPGQIEQVLMNLAVNARDAMPAGGRLTIETSALEIADSPAAANLRPGLYAVLSVTDTGRGMDAETRSHLFEPFFTTKELGRGTGLGLSTVYGIVRQSGGDIWVESAPGSGSSFKVLFPSLDAAVEIAQRPTPAGDLQVSPTREAILLVEDDAVLRRLLKDALEKQNYRVLEAGSGQEAIREARKAKFPIHLLLTDVVMPGMSGGELAQRLLSNRREMKVLYITGYAEGEQVANQRALLRKPFTLSELSRRVRDILDEPARANGAGSR
jgi:two-component system, cell cycle sensor histidine kinase and response regulator CckA